MRFRFGKFAGITPEELIGLNEDSYLQFVSTCDEWKSSEMLQYIRTTIIKDTMIQFGKYKNQKTLLDIKTGDKPYWNFLMELCKTDQKKKYLRYV
jgi:hypothetical protein